ncbi:MAG: DUF4139 domain-containing protein [Planctomycetota bacterium]|nr:DUF4139 domain-containing protein [Planctomycetota bacterium]
MHKSIFLAAVAMLSVAGIAHAQENLGDPTVHQIVAPAESVVLYQGRAQVTRTANMALEAGYHRVEFTDLPEAVQPETLQARITGGKLLDVRFETRPSPVRTGSDEYLALHAKSLTFEAELRGCAAEKAGIEAEIRYLERLLVQSATEKSEGIGNGAFDVEMAIKQLKFIREARTAIGRDGDTLAEKTRVLNQQWAAVRSEMDNMGGGGVSTRVAMVSLIVPDGATVSIALQHLVVNASWYPSYSLRANRVPGSVSVEYDAMIQQQTGESWNDVAVTLSTAQPTTSANPPVVYPVTIDQWIPRPTSGGAVNSRGGEAMIESMPSMAGEMMVDAASAEKKSLGRAMADASVNASGTAVTFGLPRKVTIESNQQGEQRTRIATVDCDPTFTHVAQPVVGEGVYFRGKAKNASDYVFLRGMAQVFLDGDFIGPMVLNEIPAGGEFDLFFGIDSSITAKRTIVTNKTEAIGLFGGGLETQLRYRIDLVNASSRAASVEVWDRIPVSRTSEIKVALIAPSAPIATDKEYTDVAAKQGLLKWIVPLGAADTKGPTKLALTWGVDVSRKENVQTTPIPE